MVGGLEIPFDQLQFSVGTIDDDDLCSCVLPFGRLNVRSNH